MYCIVIKLVNGDKRIVGPFETMEALTEGIKMATNSDDVNTWEARILYVTGQYSFHL